MDKGKVLSLRHLLLVSVAVNVGLFVRLGYLGEGWRADQNLDGICFGEKRQNREAPVKDFSREVVHVGKGKLVETASSSVARSDVEDGGQRDINLNHGDPTMYEGFWKQMGDKTTVVISGSQYISYFSDVTNVCWFLEPEFAKSVVRLHNLVGNAITEGRHIVVGTGSTQLYQAALYALCTPDASEPMSVVSAAPFYSSYPLMTDFLKSGLFKWAGDAHKFSQDRPYIELVTSPNNPDGSTRKAVVNRKEGILIHDLAYYWPQYTPIDSPADHELMLFTVSKSTGHAGARIGWALVKDQEVARKMTEYIEINTIGVSKDSQLRAAKILQAVADSCDHVGSRPKDVQPFFEHIYILMEKRWKQLRAVVAKSQLFSLPNFSPARCNFSGRKFETQPAFAWLKCEAEVEDCQVFLRRHHIQTRGGEHFGVDRKYVRISMLPRDEMFDLFTERLSEIQSSSSPM